MLGNKNTLETVQYGVEGSTTFLECQARSPHVSLKWHLQRENSDRRKEVGGAPRTHTRTHAGMHIQTQDRSHSYTHPKD